MRISSRSAFNETQIINQSFLLHVLLSVWDERRKAQSEFVNMSSHLGQNSLPQETDPNDIYMASCKITPNETIVHIIGHNLRFLFLQLSAFGPADIK